MQNGLLANNILTNSKQIPFAYDPGGWHFIIDLNEGTDYGKIYLVPLDDDELIYVAESFDVFIRECSEEDNF